MSDTLVRIGPTLAVITVVLAIIATAVAWLGGTGHAAAIIRAVLRATVQLALLALILGVVVRNLWLAAPSVAVMAAVAAFTAARRLRSTDPRGSAPRPPSFSMILRCLLSVAVFPVTLLTVMIGLRVIPATGLAIIPTAGILIGACMNTTSVCGRRAHDELHTRHGETEAALALGFSPYWARLEVCRTAAATALIPALDQTRTVGLVTIPGAFVGMVLGGASAQNAAITQLFVLVAILAGSSIALVSTTDMVARDKL
ncbi:ABC transporter permease [Williamsia sp. CHRR-6]|uniref:ABC transporter permease n=1 Tax=Williamsia sp. CHRR-6 TaxID=2835871 RepID=UPI001BDB2B2F|nr:ABC transporter permease [Williamsia sp. CHRR-6]MBT0567670.1 ABC transporter permease [Williamsia sp. CHRR-6]